MSRFVTRPIDSIKGKQRFEELVIINNPADILRIDEIEGAWRQYEKSLEARYKKPFKHLMILMERVADLKSLPETKFRDITPDGELVKEYEFKSGDLRIYCIKIPNGKLVVLGGYKNRQKDDFRRFRSLKKQYLDSLNLKINDKGRIP